VSHAEPGLLAQNEPSACVLLGPRYSRRVTRRSHGGPSRRRLRGGKGSNGARRPDRRCRPRTSQLSRWRLSPAVLGRQAASRAAAGTRPTCSQARRTARPGARGPDGSSRRGNHTATSSRSPCPAPGRVPPGTAPGTATSRARGAASRSLVEHTSESRALAGNLSGRLRWAVRIAGYPAFETWAPWAATSWQYRRGQRRRPGRRGDMTSGTACVWVRSADGDLARSDVITWLRCRGGGGRAFRWRRSPAGGPGLPARLPAGSPARIAAPQQLARRAVGGNHQPGGDSRRRQVGQREAG
jgi:hypothetical protein